MHPDLYTFSIDSSSWTLEAYPLFLLFAMLATLFGVIFAARSNSIPRRSALTIFFAMSAAAFIGARLFHGLTNLGFYRQHPERWFSLDFQGFALFGGILLAVLTGIISCRLHRIDFWAFSDRFVPFLGISIALVRVGCFLNGCCFGTETTLPWSVTFPLFSPAHKHQLAQDTINLFSSLPVHPTQLYELTAALVGSLIATYFLKKKMPAGTAALVFGIWFSLFRLGNSFLRVPAASFEMPDYFYPVFYAVIVIILTSILLKKTAQYRYNTAYRAISA